MGILLEEAAPVVLRQLIRPLMQLAGFAVALGIIYNLHNFVRAVVGGVAGIVTRAPIIGNILKGPVNAVYHWMDTEFGKAEQFLDARMAASMHELARLVEWVGKEFKDHAALLLAIADITAHPFSLPAWKAYAKALLAEAHTATTAIRHAGTGYIGAAIHTAVAPLNIRITALDRWVHTRIQALQHSIAVTIPNDIAGLRARTRAIEDRFSSIAATLRRHETLLGIGAMTAVVTAVLSRLGLDWLRCRNLSRRGTSLCNMDDALFEALLADTLLIFGSLSLVEFAREMVDVTDTAVRPITSFWRAS